MKKFIALAFFLAGLAGHAQKIDKPTVVETSCGSCNFGMKSKGCELAVKIDGKAYLVDGAKLHDFGDAHAKDGMCEVVRKAQITGEVVEGRFKAKTFKLLPSDSKEPKID